MADQDLMKFLEHLDEGLQIHLHITHEEDGNHCPGCSLLNDVANYFLTNGLTITEGTDPGHNIEAPPGTTFH